MKRWWLVWALSMALLCAAGAFAQGAGESELCTFKTRACNVLEKRSVDHRTVTCPYDALPPEVVDVETGCTVCYEDQEWIELDGLERFRMCMVFAPQVREALRELLDAAEPITQVSGYRVIQSKGPLDAQGNRTQFSNHSFGVAIDINRGLNGLYTDCYALGPECRLELGGPWLPGAPGTLVADGTIVQAFKRLDIQWGGEIAGRQKDFMHFSPTGY